MNMSSNDALKIYTGNIITHFSHASKFESSSYKNLKQKVTCAKWLLSTNLRQTKACQFGWNKTHYTPMRLAYNRFIEGKSTLVNGCMHIIHARRMSNVKCAEVCNLYDWVRTIGGNIGESVMHVWCKTGSWSSVNIMLFDLSIGYSYMYSLIIWLW